MCGICGIVDLNHKPVLETSLKPMMKAMKHRGPDDEGTFIKGNTGLGFVRLSIIDLSLAGHQPMISADGRYAIVMNGEIYNYIELKKELASVYSFKSNTDTEVLLAAYIRWGQNCLDRLNGMFAFAILDTFSNNLFAARDRFGIKPFYYFFNNNFFCFASDIPPLLQISEIKREANDSAVFDYLIFNRTNHTEGTFFRNILKLQHGHFLTIKGGVLKIQRWYNLKDKLNDGGSHFTQKDFLEELRSSINLQLRSDVPVGTCLSGGLDSSTITSLVLENINEVELHSFSAVYGKGQKGDESEYIAEFKNKNLHVHYTYPNENTLFEDMDNFLLSLSEPVPTTSIYAEYKVMQLAKDYCTVLLNGQGADEILAGYHYFYGYYFRDLMRQNSWNRFINELYSYIKTHKSFFGIKSLIFSLNPRQLRYFKSHSNYENQFYNNHYNSTNQILDEFYDSRSLKEFLLKHFEYKFEHHLLWADKTGMRFSLETRFPFLDHNLVEKTLSLSSDNYIKNGYTKVILREALKGILPEKIRIRKDKIGFSTPQADWFKNKKFQNILYDIVASASFNERGYFNVNQCKKEVKSLQEYGHYNSEFWKWINLELWFRKFID